MNWRIRWKLEPSVKGEWIDHAVVTPVLDAVRPVGRRVSDEVVRHLNPIVTRGRR